MAEHPRYNIAAFFGLLLPVGYVLIAAWTITTAISAFQAGNTQNGWLSVIIAVVALFMLWNSRSYWGKLAEKFRSKKD